MDALLEYAAPLERRRKPRIYKPFRVKVSGVMTDGKAFEVATVLDNLSFGGLFLRLKQEVAKGTELSIEIRLSTAEIDEIPVAMVAVEGVVIRVETPSDEEFGVAVAIKRHRFTN